MKTIVNASAWAAVMILAGMAVPNALADSVSYTGTLDSPTSLFEVTLTLGTTSDVILQTYGFGGGVNQQGDTIPQGGTDPFLAIFQGTGPGATLLTDPDGNPFGTSLVLSNYDDFTGCTPANTPVIGGSPACGDIQMLLNGLGPGTYTIVLSDGQFIANAVFDNGTLGEGFTDLTGGIFCNLSINGEDCPNTTGAYALDVITKPTVPTTPAPEPTTAVLVGLGIAAMKISRRWATPGTTTLANR